MIVSYTLCLKKVHRFYFCDYSVKCWPVLTIFSSIAADKSCKQMTYFFLIKSSVCMNITQWKNNILHAFNAAISSWSGATFLQLFRKFVQSPRSPAFIQKFRNKLFCSIAFKRTNFRLKFDLCRWNPCLHKTMHQTIVCYQATRVQYPNK